MVMMNAITDKVTELKTEMKRIGLWKKQVPYWVNEFTQPNMMQLENRSSMGAEKYIVPQAVQFFGTDVQKGELLQLLIELDSLL
jgi:ubiquinone/menaquinone biosynthesis C-methylase UbiE